MKKKKLLAQENNARQEDNNLIGLKISGDEISTTDFARVVAPGDNSQENQALNAENKLEDNQKEKTVSVENESDNVGAQNVSQKDGGEGQNLGAQNGESGVEEDKKPAKVDAEEKSSSETNTSGDEKTSGEAKQSGEAKAESADKKGEEKKEEVPPFVTYGGDVTIKEADNIFYYKTRYRFLTATFKLVGKFDSKGRYIVSDDVKRELIKLVKEIDFASEDEYRASISYFGKEFRFLVKITPLNDGKSKASLYMEEYVGKSLKEEYLVTKIADYVDKNDDEFRIKVRKAFSLSDIAIAINEFEVPNITVIMQNALDVDLVVGELFDMASQIYLLRLLKLLEETPEGREIIAKYKSLLDGSENAFERKFTYLRMLLERVIDDNGGFEVLGLKKEDKKKLVNDLLLSIQNLKKQAKDQGGAIVEAQKKADDKKQAGATKAPAKNPGKKPDKKGKKPDKKGKKDKKKKDKDSDKKSSPIVFYIDDAKPAPAKTVEKAGSTRPAPAGKQPEKVVAPEPSASAKPRNPKNDFLDFEIFSGTGTVVKTTNSKPQVAGNGNDGKATMGEEIESSIKGKTQTGIHEKTPEPSETNLPSEANEKMDATFYVNDIEMERE